MNIENLQGALRDILQNKDTLVSLFENIGIVEENDIEFSKRLEEENRLDKMKRYKVKWYRDNINICKEQRRRNYLEHKEEYILRSKKRREANKEFCLAYGRQYYAEHKEQNAVRCKKYYVEHKEEITQYKKDWYQRNKERINTERRERYRQKKEAEKMA